MERTLNDKGTENESVADLTLAAFSRPIVVLRLELLNQLSKYSEID